MGAGVPGGARPARAAGVTPRGARALRRLVAACSRVRGRARSAAGAWAAAIAALLSLSACQRWNCSFDSHGACIEFDYEEPDLADAKARVDRLLDLELAFWDLSKLDGWRLQFRRSSSYPCYFATRNDGCTDYLSQTISVRVPPDAPDCFEAAEVLHELGHYKLGDPMHSASRWKDVDAQFSTMVWDRPDAAPACVERYEGIRSGMWPVRVDGF